MALAGVAHADEVSAWRLFVADHAQPTVTAIDLEAGETIAAFELASPATLYTTSTGSAVFAVQGAGNSVSAIRSGITIDDHGDHGDIEVTAPELVEATINGDRPVHFVENEGDIALFFDGTGLTSIIGETAWLTGNAPEPRLIDSGVPHHGVAIPWGAYALVSQPHPEDPTNLPVGMNVIDASGAQVGDTHACPDLHGEAHSGNLFAIACAEGILLASGGESPEIVRIDYAGLPEGKATTLIGGQGLQYFLGNFGPSRVILFDPLETDQPFRLVELPTRRVHFAVDPVRSRYAYIFTEDGVLHRLDVIRGAIDATLRLTEPYSMDGEWSDPRPRIAVAGDTIAVTDPLAGVIRLVDAEAFGISGEIAVEGTPFGIVAVGGSGTAH